MDTSKDGQERFRVVLSDVNNFIQCMIATQSNHLVHSGSLSKNCIIRLNAFQPNVVKGKKILVILDLEVLEAYQDKIGQPQALDPAPEAQDGQAQQAQQPQGVSANGFYGAKPAQQQPVQAPQRSLPSRANGSSNASHGNLYPIEALSPYAHKWTIKARCTHKSDVKEWHNKNGQGKLFSVTLMDDSGEIRATGFTDSVDALYDVFQENQVYYISAPCAVKLAKKQFSTVNNDYELTFERETVVEKAENTDDVPQVRYNFTPIGELTSVENQTTIDTIGVLKEVGEVSEITSKTTSKPYAKRELTLVDSTLSSVRLTIWGNTATQFDVQPESVVAFKGVKVSDFGGRSLSLLSSGSMTVDPDIDEAHKLKGWYDAQGRQDNFTAYSAASVAGGGVSSKNQEFHTVQQVRDENLGLRSEEEADYFSVRATVVYVRQENTSYPGCRTKEPKECNKKLIETNPGEWSCERCNTSFDAPEYRYILSVSVADHTGQMWLTCFNEQGKVVMGISANELEDLKKRAQDEDVKEPLLEAFAGANFQTFNFRCRAKMDNYQDQQRYGLEFHNTCEEYKLTST